MNSEYDQLSQELSRNLGESFGKSSLGRQGVNSGGAMQTGAIRPEFPHFDGQDPSGWAYRAEQFFVYHQTPATQRMVIASFHLEGKSL